MKNGGILHRIWWHTPQVLWRPYCWLRGRHESDSYGACAICRKPEEESDAAA